jgi:hypothetical protein
MNGFVDIDQLLKYQISCPDAIICQDNQPHYTIYSLYLSFKIVRNVLLHKKRFELQDQGHDKRSSISILYIET